MTSLENWSMNTFLGRRFYLDAFFKHTLPSIKNLMAYC
jgi:hypothetical protein